MWERSEAASPQLLDASPYARRYDSDAFNLYQSAVYAGVHQAMPDKRQTYREPPGREGNNAELRHYLARRQWTSPGFSCSLEARRTAAP